MKNSNYKKTLETYKKGKKSDAYNLFTQDSTANKGIGFDAFCKAMDKNVRNTQSVCPSSGRVEKS